MGNNGKSDRLYFLELQNHCGLWLQPWNKKTLVPWRKSYDKPRQHIEKQRHYFADKVLSSQSCGFPISRVQVWELDFKEGWVPNNWCFWTVMLEKILYSPLDIKEINQSILKEINPEYALAPSSPASGLPGTWTISLPRCVQSPLLRSLLWFMDGPIGQGCWMGKQRALFALPCSSKLIFWELYKGGFVDIPLIWELIHYLQIINKRSANRFIRLFRRRKYHG